MSPACHGSRCGVLYCLHSCLHRSDYRGRKGAGVLRGTRNLWLRSVENYNVCAGAGVSLFVFAGFGEESGLQHEKRCFVEGPIVRAKRGNQLLIMRGVCGVFFCVFFVVWYPSTCEKWHDFWCMYGCLLGVSILGILVCAASKSGGYKRALTFLVEKFIQIVGCLGLIRRFSDSRSECRGEQQQPEAGRG